MKNHFESKTERFIKSTISFLCFTTCKRKKECCQWLLNWILLPSIV